MSAIAITYALLSAASGVTSIAGTRIAPGLLGEGTALPAVVMLHVSTVDVPTIDAASAGTLTRRSRVQVNAVAQDYATAAALAAACKAALQFQRGTIAGQYVASIVRDYEHPDDFDPDLHSQVVAADYLIVWTG